MWKKRENNKPSHVAYIRIQVSNMKKAQEFYEALGLVVVVKKQNEEKNNPSLSSMLLLQSPLHWFLRQPYILLKEGPMENTNKRPLLHAAEHVGIARMCLIVKDVKALVGHLETNWGYHPMGPPVDGKLPRSSDDISVAAYRDPSGSNNIVELLSFQKPNLLMSLASRVVTLFPLVLHVNVNVTNYDTSLRAYQDEALGFALSQDFGRCGDDANDDSNLHRAIAIPDPGIAKHVSLLQLPKDKMFVVEMMEWEDPKTTRTDQTSQENDGTPVVSFAILVPNIATALKEMCSDNNKEDTNSKMWRQSHGPSQVLLPAPLGLVTRAAVLDPNGMKIELISYTLG